MKAVFTKVNHSYRPLEDRPFPDYEPFGVKDMLDNYSMATRVLYRYSRLYPRPYNIVGSRSCPFDCTFCVHGRREIPYRARSIENIITEIKESYEKYHFNILILLDELFAVSKGRLQMFSDAVYKGRADFGWDFDWCFQTHASARFDKASLQSAKRAGCYLFSYGLESASPTVLRSMGKKTRIEQIVEAIELAKEVGICFSGNLIFGDPAETEQTIRESLYFYFEHCRDEMVFLSMVTPYPGSKIFDDCAAKGLIKDKRHYYEHIDNFNINMTAMPDNVYTQWMKLLQGFEPKWAWVKGVPAIKYEKDGGFDLITALCPHCGKEVVSRQLISVRPTFLGVGCLNCGRKIRVDVS